MSFLNSISIQPLILSGGSGTRLWPLSRECFPKQYLPLNSSSKYSALQRTYQRLNGLKNIQSPIIICNEEQRFIVAEQMREINIKPKSIILEPFGRNTAPAIVLGALKAQEDKKDPLLLILSSDHEIRNNSEFLKAIESSLDSANKDELVTLGIIPTFPCSGYGYIQVKNAIEDEKNIPLSISKFIEKPSVEKARELIKSNCVLWNSGIFIFKASQILNEVEKYQPELLEICKKTFINSHKDFDFQRVDPKTFKNCPNLSIDVAIMEKTSKGFVVPFKGGWSDIGSWKSLWEIERKNKNGNVIIGDALVENVKNSYIRSEKRLIVGIGLKNLIVVETPDAVLVASSEETQNTKLIVNKLNELGRPEAKEHRKMFRPWGYYVLIEKSSNWQVKKIVVNPGASLSLQKHNFRSEHWIILKGKALIENNNSKIFLKKNQSTYIPIGTKHRLSNKENKPLILIEVQSGSYLGEDDIIRFDDNYGRNQDN